MNKGLVSVIVPVYNSSEFIKTTIDNLLLQSYKKIEIIIIDDGSNDGTSVICRELKLKDSRIVVFEQINKGVSEARNKGMELARGEYVVFLDSDDMLTNDAIEKFVNCMEDGQDKPDIVFCDYERVNGNEKKIMGTPFESFNVDSDEFISKISYFMESNLIHNIGTKIYKKSIIDNNALKFDGSMKIYEDISFCVLYLSKCKRVGYINKPLYKYRMINNNSLSSRLDDYYAECCLKYLMVLFAYLRLCGECGEKIYTRECFSRLRDIYFLKIDNRITLSADAEKKIKMDPFLLPYIREREKWLSWNELIIFFMIKNQWEKCIYYCKNIKKIIRVLAGIIYDFVFDREKYLIKKEIIHNLLFNCFWMNIYSLLNTLSNNRISAIFMFHRITNLPTNICEYNINVHDFERGLIKYLKKMKPMDIKKIRGDNGNNFYITFDDGYESFYIHAYPILKRYKIPFTLFITTAFLDKPNYLTTNQLKILDKDPLCTIGGHTKNHPKLNDCADSYYEIFDGKMILEKLLNHPVELFAFPYGSGAEVTWRNILEAHRAGFRYVFSTIPAYMGVRTKRLCFFLPRLDGDRFFY